MDSALIEQGNTALEEKRYDEALALFEQALVTEPENPDALYGKATSLWRQKRYDEALVACEAGLAVTPTTSRLWHRKGSVLGDMGNHSDALLAFAKAIELDPTDAKPWTQKGNVLWALGCHTEALEAFDGAIARNDEADVAWNGRGNALYDLGRYTEALEAFDSAISRNGESIAPWNGRGSTLAQLRRYAEALEAFDGAIAREATNAILWDGRGNVLGSLGRYTEALKAYDEAIALDPKNPNPWNGKGNVLFSLGKLEAEKRDGLGDGLDRNRFKEAQEANLRTAYLAGKMTGAFAHRRLTSLVSLWLKNGSAPLLCVRLVQELGIRDAALHTLAGLSDAEEAALMYTQASLITFGSESPLSHTQALRTLGLMAFALGDPFEAQRHFDSLKTEDETDLLGWYYLAQCYYAYAETTIAQEVVQLALEQAEAVRRNPRAASPETVYYAGLLFWLVDGREVYALQCFRAAAERGSLPALYLEASVAHRLGQTQEEDRAYRDVARVESDLYESGTEHLGFLVPFDPPPLDLGNPDWPAQILHAAHVAEVQESVEGFFEWLDQQRERGLLVRSAGRLDEAAVIYDPAWHMLDDFRLELENTDYQAWRRMVVAESSVARMRKEIEERTRDTLAALEQKARERFPDLVESALSPDALENRIAAAVKESVAAHPDWTPYYELAVYLAAAGRLEPRAVLRLTVFGHLQSPRNPDHEAIRDEMLKGALGQFVVTGGSAGLVMAGLTPLLGPIAAGVIAASTAAGLTQYAVQLAGRLRRQGISYPFYTDYKEHFEEHLLTLVGTNGIRGIDHLLDPTARS